MTKINMLNTRTRGETVVANALLQNKSFVKSRKKTLEGKRTLNKEIRRVKKRAKELRLNINEKKLPKPVRLRRRN